MSSTQHADRHELFSSRLKAQLLFSFIFSIIWNFLLREILT